MGNSVENILSKPFHSRGYEDQLKIIEAGKPCPPLPTMSNLVDSKKVFRRQFHVTKYKSIEWMTGCEIRVKLFCWPCLLFSSEISVWNKWGYSDLNNISMAEKRHERSMAHIKASMEYKMFSKQNNGPTDSSQCETEVSQHNVLVNKNRDVLKRIIDVVCYLAKQELSLLSHNESCKSTNGSNFIEFLKVLRDYDSLLDVHMTTATEFRGTSVSLKNDIIQTVANIIEEHIKKEVNAAIFVAIILEETSDVLSKSKLATVLRFVNEGKTHGRFVGFTDISARRTSDDLFDHIVNIVETYKLEHKFVSYTYNGATLMSDQVRGFQCKVHNEYNAIFTHYNDHALSKMVAQGLFHIEECRSFFQTVNGLSDFFYNYPERISALNDLFTKKCPNERIEVWNFTSCMNSVIILQYKQYRHQFVCFFQHILENSERWDSDTVVKARGFLLLLEEFQMILLLSIFSTLFAYTDDLYNTLQNKSSTMLDCGKISIALSQLLEIKEHGFDDFWSYSFSQKSDEHNHMLKRQKMSFDDDERNHFVDVYNKICDGIRTQIECRFASLPNLRYYELLCHRNYSDYLSIFPNKLVSKLETVHGTLFEYSRLKNEISTLYASYEFHGKNLHELLDYMDKNNLDKVYRQVIKLGHLILTIPRDCVVDEFSRSSMKRVISYCGVAYDDHRLNGLTLISIEKALLIELKQRNTFYTEVIEKLTNLRPRPELTYK